MKKNTFPNLEKLTTLRSKIKTQETKNNPYSEKEKHDNKHLTTRISRIEQLNKDKKAAEEVNRGLYNIVHIKNKKQC